MRSRTENAHPGMILGALLIVGACGLAASALLLRPAVAEAAESGERKGLIQEVTTEQIKRFLDPTWMISRLTYDFQMNFLPSDIELMTHRVSPWFALGNSQAVWVEIPFLDFSFPLQDAPSGIGDLVAGWGIIVHEDLSKRLTTVAAGLEVSLPTGESAEGLGFGKTVLAPAVVFAMNPTDLFPVYFTSRYLHSIETEGSSQEQGRPVRSLDLSLRTFHILPQGFFVAFLPTFVVDLERDFDIFSLGLGLGRALNRRLSIQGGYVQYIAGQKTFNRAFTVGLTWLWGQDQGAG